MNLSEKIPYAVMHLRSIAKHTDDDGNVRKAALDLVIAEANTLKADIDAEVAAEIAALTGEG